MSVRPAPLFALHNDRGRLRKCPATLVSLSIWVKHHKSEGGANENPRTTWLKLHNVGSRVDFWSRSHTLKADCLINPLTGTQSRYFSLLDRRPLPHPLLLLPTIPPPCSLVSFALTFPRVIQEVFVQSSLLLDLSSDLLKDSPLHHTAFCHTQGLKD